MFRMWPLVCVVLMLWLCGCGDSGGENNNKSLNVNIQSDRVVPKTTTVTAGDTVKFINTDSQPHQVVSGTLISVPNPQTIGPVSIQSDNTFVPSSLDIGLGDTVLFRNDRVSQITLDVVNDAGNVVSSLVLNAGDLEPFSGFPGAGQYSIQQRNNSLFALPVTVRGVPNPDLKFQSTILTTGETFFRQFTTTGSNPYYVTDPTSPDRPFITGTVNVQ